MRARSKSLANRRFNVLVEWRDPLAEEPSMTAAAATYQILAEESVEAAITALAKVATGKHPSLPTYAEISCVSFLSEEEMRELREMEAS